ncbi:uncharacterized protein [Solanum lycopersicum]|uniref:uncharacterized protein n=1 Tax=Solanum lycopersicum TaxID=4081 RepID=UPI00374881C3
MSTLKDKKNNDIAGQGSQPFTSPILSENQNQNNINNHNAAQGRQHFTSHVLSENQNQMECDESSNDDNKKFLQDHSIFENSNVRDKPDIVGGADKQVCWLTLHIYIVQLGIFLLLFIINIFIFLKVHCDNSPVRNLISVDAGFSSSKSIIPSVWFSTYLN